MDNEFDSGCESGRFFCCPGSAAYGILEEEIPVAEKPVLLLFYYFWRPRFAAFCCVLPSDEFHFGKRGTELIRRELRKMRHPAA
jgi:hypothetical protein